MLLPVDELLYSEESTKPLVPGAEEAGAGAEAVNTACLPSFAGERGEVYTTPMPVAGTSEDDVKSLSLAIFTRQRLALPF